MSASIPYVDILIFAIIAIFLGLRLRSVLGKRTGFESDESRDQEMVEAISKPINKAEQSFANGDGVEAIVQADHSSAKRIRQGWGWPMA